LIGPFSRLDYQLDRRGSKQPVVKGYKNLLPATATDIYYRDLIGNISTSNVRKVKNAVEVELRPRFPLYGGWKTSYVLGYNLPTSAFLSYDGPLHQLRMRVVDKLFENSVIEHLTVKIILPEHSSEEKLITPYSVNRLNDSLHYTYLDITGRTVITFTKDLVVDSHSQSFTLQYHFSSWMILKEPVMVVIAFFVLFVSAIIYVRLDFSLSSNRHED